MNIDVLAAKSTWAVLCTPETGKPFPEYVEGTAVTRDDGDIQIWDGPTLVKAYPQGSWSNFCEWVAVPELHRLDIIRLADDATGPPTQRRLA